MLQQSEEQRQNLDFQLTEADSFWLLNRQHSEDLWLDTPAQSLIYIVFQIISIILTSWAFRDACRSAELH